jgi:restriction endonuclease S subunit
MSSYTISKSLNPKRVFILQKSELEKRFDPFFYVPELLELERKVLAKKPKKLRDYVVSVSSGATPKTTESELYYAEKENGIPFLRVQNLSPTGVLEFDDCKYINHETHNGMLKRSQVSAGDLLVKITGVGRMAIASVAPEGFIGNINQHVCVIKTGSKEISETLAAFLNSDIGEKLASRRSAGGTRPALDYPALLSIPIIEDKRILKITAKVIEQKQKNEAEAEQLLSSIDDYLLKELGIKLPEPPENTLKNRIYKTSINQVTGNRFDPFFHQAYFLEVEKAIKATKFKADILRNQLSFIESGSRPKGGATRDDEGILSLGGEHVNSFCEVQVRTAKYIPIEFHKSILSTETKLKDILFVKDGATTGKVGMINKKEYAGQNINEHVFLLRPITAINAFYLVNYLNSKVAQIIIKKLIAGATVTGITKDALKSLPIPIPTVDKQKEIANHVTDIRNKAQQLKDKTKELLKKASEEIEEILLK